MIKLARCAVLLLTLITLSLLTACGGDNGSSEPAIPTTPSNLAEQIDQYLASHQSDTAAGISVLILKDGKEIYSANKGMANKNSGTVVSRNTGFRLASVSKSFTAIAIMQLVEKGDLKLTDSILDYIPELPTTWQAITIEQLLTHQSGIYDFVNDLSLDLNNLTINGVISYFIANPALRFQPGSQGRYSNTGYILLATIIERNTGLRFSEYMARNVFELANMKGSYINDEYQEIKPGDAINYANTYFGVTKDFYGATAQVSSTDDFSHFFEALREGKLVSIQTLNTMTTKYSDIGFGYGFFVSNSLYNYSHSGSEDGFQTQFAVDSAQHLETVILTNSGRRGRDHIEAIVALINSAYP